jgi:GH15 family glucan-1,4-alpha-glucosidase
VAQRIFSFEAPMRRAADAVANGVPRAPDDYLPCRFEAGGRAPRGDGWGAFQLDGPGLWLWALAEHERASGTTVVHQAELRGAATMAATYLSSLWRQPSYDAWEEEPERRSTSTLAACLAGLDAAHRLGLELPGMLAEVEGMRHDLDERGRRLGYLPRSDGDDAVDASILWCGPLLGVFRPDDPLWRSTLERIEAELVGAGGGVHRYRADEFYGGGEWPLLSAAYGLACLQRGDPGDHARARRCAAWIELQRGRDGSLPEQASERLLRPARLSTWQARWGPVARPLSWSHAMALLLRQRLEPASPTARTA